MSYVVCGSAALVTLGGQSVLLAKGAPVPESAPADQVDHLVAVGLIAEVKPAPAKATPAKKPGAKV